jgi:hypothetical protein
VRILDTPPIFNSLVKALDLLHIATRVLCVGPMRCANPPLKSISLLNEVFLGCIYDRHIARIHTESWCLALWAEVVVRRSAVPEEQVAGLGAHFDPFTTFIGEPF